MDEMDGVATAWDAQYRAGRYRHEPPVAFTRDILAAARAAGLAHGLYVGCGNGRNYLPLVAGGLDLTGLDISATAIAQLGASAPDRRHRLVCGDLAVLPAGAMYPLVIGIQVFQHGDRAAAHAHIRAAQAAQLRRLFASQFTPVLPLRLHRTRRVPPAPGQWSQWEAIWRKAG
jgi:Methyltransferase domain